MNVKTCFINSLSYGLQDHYLPWGQEHGFIVGEAVWGAHLSTDFATSPFWQRCTAKQAPEQGLAPNLHENIPHAWHEDSLNLRGLCYPDVIRQDMLQTSQMVSACYSPVGKSKPPENNQNFLSLFPGKTCNEQDKNLCLCFQPIFSMLGNETCVTKSVFHSNVFQMFSPKTWIDVLGVAGRQVG